MKPFRVYTSLKKIPKTPRVVVLGNFDGLHRGHQALIQRGRALAEDNGASLVVFTFYPQQQSVRDPSFRYLLSQFDKMSMLASLGVDEVVTVPFNDAISTLSPEIFVQDILLETLQAVDIVVGFNFKFGYKASGNPSRMEALSEGRANVHIVEPFQIDGQPVSSTVIRNHLADGNIDAADCLLGYPYHLCGEVVHGQAIGRTINFPTANIDYDQSLLLPALGVYSAKCWLTSAPEEKYVGVLNIGTRPTVDDNQDIIVEVHILDFDADIYGHDLCIEVHHFLRKIVKFDGLDALKAAIESDVVNTRAFFKQPSACR